VSLLGGAGAGDGTEFSLRTTTLPTGPALALSKRNRSLSSLSFGDSDASVAPAALASPTIAAFRCVTWWRSARSCSSRQRHSVRPNRTGGHSGEPEPRQCGLLNPVRPIGEIGHDLVKSSGSLSNGAACCSVRLERSSALWLISLEPLSNELVAKSRRGGSRRGNNERI